MVGGASLRGGLNMSATDSKAGGADYLLLFTEAKSVAGNCDRVLTRRYLVGIEPAEDSSLKLRSRDADCAAMVRIRHLPQHILRR